MSINCCFCNEQVGVSRNITICHSCYNGGKGMITLLNEADDTKSIDTQVKGISRGLNRLRMLKKKVRFLEAVAMLREGIVTDILEKLGSEIPAQKVLLAVKSGILVTMLISDDYKAKAQDSIPFSELSHDEIKCLLEFLYGGNLPASLDNSSSLNYALLIASNKYNIPFLRKQCRNQILHALEPSNALAALEVSQISSDVELKEEVIDHIVDNAEEVVLTTDYKEFVCRNALLSVDIIRALVQRGN